MVSPIAKFVVAVGLDGRIASQGTLEQALATDSKLAAELKQEKEQIAKGEQVLDKPVTDEKLAPKPTEGKLIVAEEVALGRVSWPACKSHLSYRAPRSFSYVVSKNVFVVVGRRRLLAHLYFNLRSR